jgi:LPXTG-motif cell wall-anchored protein
VSGNKAYFSARGTTGGGLFVTDGTAAGTIRLTNNGVDEVAIIGQKAYFRGYDETNGGGLWETDGTLLGTKLVKDPNPSGTSSDMGYLTAFGSKVLFVADNGVDGIEWWVSDGTEAGTNLLKDIGPGPQGGDIEYPIVVGSLLYFQADDGTNGLELWVTDGTEAGTKMLKDVDPGSDTEGPCYRPCSGDPRDFVAVGTNVFFTANTTASGRELWKTDGTAAGTVLVKDIYTGTSYGYPNNSYPNGMTELSGKLYFWANDGSGGAQLWTSDGTELGTKLLKLVNPNGYGSNQIAKANNRLFFAQYDDTNGSELWTSDGTEAGTTVVTNINTGSDGSSPDGLVSAPTAVYFRAYNGTTWGIYSSDGTEAGTKFLAAYDEGEFTARYIPFRGGLLYTNDNGTDGVELWAVGLPEGTVQTISFSPPANMKANEVVALTGTATSGLPVTYLATGQCEIKKTGKDAGKLKLRGQGFCTVRAMQGGDETWAAADDVEMTILIGKNSVVVKFIGVVPARKNSVSAFAFYSGLVQLKAEVTPALEGCEVQFTVSPNSATPAGPYTAISDEDGVVLSEPITIAPGTYDFTVTPLGDCEGSAVDAPRVYLGELPPTGADTTVFVWIGATLLAAGTLLVGRQRRRTA